MRIAKKTQELLVVKHYPSIALLTFGGYCLFSVLYIIYKTLTDVPETATSESIMVGLLICGFCVCAGSFCIYLGYEHRTIEMNRETGKGIYVRKGLFSSERVGFDLSEVNSVYSEYPVICNGADFPSYSIILSTRNREFELHSSFIYSFKPTRRIVGEISDFLNIPQSDPK